MAKSVLTRKNSWSKLNDLSNLESSGDLLMIPRKTSPFSFFDLLVLFLKRRGILFDAKSGNFFMNEREVRYYRPRCASCKFIDLRGTGFRDTVRCTLIGDRIVRRLIEYRYCSHYIPKYCLFIRVLRKIGYFCYRLSMLCSRNWLRFLDWISGIDAPEE